MKKIRDLEAEVAMLAKKLQCSEEHEKEKRESLKAQFDRQFNALGEQL